jgi:uncharacterized protein YceK
MRRIVVLFTALIVLSGAGSAASAASSGPPPGLASYGLLVWNLDALLRDTFGNHPRST